VGSLSDPNAGSHDAKLEYTATVTGMNLAIGAAALRVWKDGKEAGAPCVSRGLGDALAP
jgi:hypothetical protein